MQAWDESVRKNVPGGTNIAPNYYIFCVSIEKCVSELEKDLAFKLTTDDGFEPSLG